MAAQSCPGLPNFSSANFSASLLRPRRPLPGALTCEASGSDFGRAHPSAAHERNSIAAPLSPRQREASRRAGLPPRRRAAAKSGTGRRAAAGSRSDAGRLRSTRRPPP